jgi:lipopolysaccharide export system permease protein
MPRSRVLTRIDRYVLNQLTLALVLVTTGLVALIWLTQSLRFIQIIVNRGLSPVVFVKLTLLPSCPSPASSSCCSSTQGYRATANLR